MTNQSDSGDSERSVSLFLKGLCMGTADIIPGVSGGTMALVLGIYQRLIEAIRSVNLQWICSLAKLLLGIGHRPLNLLLEEARRLHLHFLVPLGMGILVAILAGSRLLPPLMANYPSVVRGFFFGLILSSLWIPLRWIRWSNPQQTLTAVVLLFIGIAGGFILTDPGQTFLPEKQWVTFQSSGETFGDMLQHHGSALPGHRVFWAQQNRDFRNRLRQQGRVDFETLPGPLGTEAVDKEHLNARSAPFEKITVPDSLSVNIPRLSPSFTFFVGFIAVCAMILPGVSGSYISLILGGYFFILNMIKGGLDQLLMGQVPWFQAGYLGIFAVGALGGLAVFSRILSWLLEKVPSATMALLAGLMAGCLRGIWPFRSWDNGWVNQMPHWEWLTWGPVLASFCAGLLAILLLYYLEYQTDRQSTHG